MMLRALLHTAFALLLVGCAGTTVRDQTTATVPLIALFGSAIYVAIELGRDGRRVRAR